MVSKIQNGILNGTIFTQVLQRLSVLRWCFCHLMYRYQRWQRERPVKNSSFRIPFQIFEVRTALIWGTAAFEPKKNWSDKKITELSQIFEHPIACKQ